MHVIYIVTLKNILNKKLRTNVFFLFADNIPAYLKKNDDSMPCAALLQIRNIVAFECPSRMLKLLGPVKCTG
jgi:hypothetical protein